MKNPGTIKRPAGTPKAELTQFSTPKERFQAEAKNIAQHHGLVDSPAFDRGSDAALCEYCRVLAKGVVNAESAIAAGYKLQGAVRFLDHFKTLAEQPQAEPQRPNTDVLQPTEPQRRA